MEWLVKMNFLHYAIFMFVDLLTGVSRGEPHDRRPPTASDWPASPSPPWPTRWKSQPVSMPLRKPAHETLTEHRINVVFSVFLLATVIGLWIYFR